MRFATALSTHPLATQAAGEAIGEVLEQLNGAPDLVLIGVTTPHGGSLPDISRVARQLLNPRVLLATSAAGVISGAQEIETTAAVTIWAAQFGIDIEPVRMEAVETDTGLFVTGGGPLRSNAGSLLLLTDPFSFPMEDVLEYLAAHAPDVQVIGGCTSGAVGAGANHLILDGEHFRDGAIGVWLPPTIDVLALVSQGCRPFGEPLTITKCENNVIYELGGKTALSRLNEQVERLDPKTRNLLANGLHIGSVVDELREDHGHGDFLIRGVLGADRSNGAVAVQGLVEVGTTVQFHLRDSVSAHEDLNQALDGWAAQAALLFTCTGRGLNLFAEANHDAALLYGQTEAIVGGLFCSGEFGPVAERNLVHSFSASVALFGYSRNDGAPGVFATTTSEPRSSRPDQAPNGER
jgi:small ligand-binding sensory domain FIST